MTDPTAALAEALEAAGMYEKDDPTEYPGSPIHTEDAADVQRRLAERGVRLVTEAERAEGLRLLAKLIGAHHRYMVVDREHCTFCHDRNPTYAQVLAALSGEVTE